MFSGPTDLSSDLKFPTKVGMKPTVPQNWNSYLELTI